MKTIVTTTAICLTLLTSFATAQETWTVDSHAQWKNAAESSARLEFKDGMATPTDSQARFKSKLKTFDQKRSAKSITVSQSPIWLNWEPIENIGPVNLGDAPVFLTLGPDNYWMFGRYGKNRSPKSFTPETATLEGFDIPLKTTPFRNQYDAPGGLKPKQGGYHAWQSKDMVNWIHHGQITGPHAKWMTTAEYADRKAYFYYDFPNDQDPHVYVDDDLFDGVPGKDMGMAYHDPSHGSDCAIIRDLDGQFHLILEDWSPIDASKNAWDSPLAVHAVSPNGIDGFKALAPPVDERTNPTGKIGNYKHPHWTKENPERFKTNIAEYEIHEPKQNAYGDWAAIAIGGQYYLFCDYDPAESKTMRVAWFTSPDINQQFKFCSSIGEGHPDPDICFAEGRFYLATQQKTDYVSDGPWVESVEVRVGVDTDNDGSIDKWTDWSKVQESYDYIPGFAKQVSRKPASLDLADLPDGFGFQFEVRVKDTTENESIPILDKIELAF